jgi:hypothetical protein
MLTNGIILAISEHDTLRPRDIWFRPFANSVCDIKYHKQCTIIVLIDLSVTFLRPSSSQSKEVLKRQNLHHIHTILHHQSMKSNETIRPDMHCNTHNTISIMNVIVQLILLLRVYDIKVFLCNIIFVVEVSLSRK